jgi:hypothetical protein
MTDTDYPWDPPIAGTEAAHLTGALDRLRATFRFKAMISMRPDCRSGSALPS